MEHPDHRAFSFSADPARLIEAPWVELVLTGADGEPWVLRMSPGSERFIGYYPRLGGISSGGPLLSFSRSDVPGVELPLPDEAFDDDEDIWPAAAAPSRSAAESGEPQACGEARRASPSGERMRRIGAALRRRLRR